METILLVSTCRYWTGPLFWEGPMCQVQLPFIISFWHTKNILHDISQEMKAVFSFCLLGSDCISKIWHNFRRIWSGKYLHSEILWMEKRYWLLFNFSNLHENTLIVFNFQNQHILIFMHIYVLSWGTPFPSPSTCNVSVISKPDHPPGQFFWRGKFPTPRKKTSSKPSPPGL